MSNYGGTLFVSWTLELMDWNFECGFCVGGVGCIHQLYIRVLNACFLYVTIKIFFNM